jgi:poly(beta-D-mannuronate) lyase
MVTTKRGMAVKLPRDLIEFNGPGAAWKIALDTPLGGGTNAEEKSAAELANGFTSAEFAVVDNEPAVSFRARVNGARTSYHTKYPRTELREMRAAAPTTPAAWSIEAPTARSMRYDVAVTVAPKRKPQVVCGQIHDAENDVLEIMYDGNKHAIVYRWYSQTQPDALITGYDLGTFFTLQVDVGGGDVTIHIDGVPKATKSTKNSGCYFKAGCYTQSNLDIEKDPKQYGEVWIKNVLMTGGGV